MPTEPIMNKVVLSSLFCLFRFLGASAQAADLGAIKGAPAAPAYVSPWDLRHRRGPEVRL